jgi:hypothetical protein
MVLKFLFHILCFIISVASMLDSNKISNTLLVQKVCTLSGHTSSLVATRGCFVEAPQSLKTMGHLGWFASADETSHRPFLWDLNSGTISHRLRAHPTEVSQVLSGTSGALGTILASMSPSKLNVYKVAGVAFNDPH